jgi:hypothetical protein
MTPVHPVGNQARELRAAEAAQVAKIGEYDAPVSAPSPR